MNKQSLLQILIDSVITNNFVLSVFLGMCPFLGVSGRFDTAWRMGVSVVFVCVVSAALSFAVNLLLVAFHAEYLRLICYIVIIASTVQLIEMFIKKTSPALFRALGVYLPLITTNCAVLAIPLFQTAREYNFVQSMVFAFAASGGFALALILMSVIRERTDLSDIPSMARGTALTLVLAAILSLAFMGFAGIGGGGE